jgi:hypothetical protein
MAFLDPVPDPILFAEAAQVLAEAIARADGGRPWPAAGALLLHSMRQASRWSGVRLLAGN